MGCAAGKPEEFKQHEEVEKRLKKYKAQWNNEIKLLLLGTGESGKSTIAKQMRIIHSGGFSEDELKRARTVLIANTIISMKTIIEATKKLNYQILEKNKERAEWFANIDLRQEEIHAGVLQELKPEYTSPQMVSDITELWNDPGVQEAFENRNKYQLMDSARYCFDNLNRFINADFVATEADLLRARERTSGIVETTFVVKDTNFRMKESLELFEEICNSKWFTKTAIILFLNKFDLFKEKIAKTDLSVLFPDYTGGKDVDAAKQFIQDQFIALNRNPKKKIFAHVTTATDTENVRVVFNVAREVIISQNFANLGFGSL